MGLQTSIWKNNIKVFYLIFLFPTLLFGIVFLILFYLNGYLFDQILIEQFKLILFIGIPLITVWLIISIIFQRQLIFKFTGAEKINRNDYFELYNIVENLAISRGYPIPNIGIINDDGINAFATGWGKENSWIVFSKGMIDKLSKDEIEAVAGHEMSHIINNDVKLMVIIVCFIGIIAKLGEILIRFGRGSKSSNKGKNPLPLIGIGFIILGYLFLPLINLAISRKKEYLADAGSVQLTKNPQSLINAFKKITNNSNIKKIKNTEVANMFIVNPIKKQGKKLAFLKELFSTHPPLEKRIKVLEEYL